MVRVDVIPGRRLTDRIVALNRRRALTLRVLGVFRNCVSRGGAAKSCSRVIATAAN